jgi:hypothetical protein
MYYLTLNINVYSFKSFCCLLIDGDEIHFYNMYHNFNNYNVHARSIEHEGEEWCCGITILV